jgi:hypothetical protein
MCVMYIERFTDFIKLCPDQVHTPIFFRLCDLMIINFCLLIKRKSILRNKMIFLKNDKMNLKHQFFLRLTRSVLFWSIDLAMRYSRAKSMNLIELGCTQAPLGTCCSTSS